MHLSENGISVELLGIFKLQREKYVNVKSHPRSYDTISIRLSGSCEFKTQKDNFSVKRGDLLYLPSGIEYQQCTDSETIIAIHFMNYSWQDNDQAKIIHLDDTEYVENTIIQMYDIWKGLKVGYHYKCTALLYELLYHLCCLEHSTSINSITDDYKIKNAHDLIHSNYRKSQISITELAEACALSEAYFRKLFKKIHGTSPAQYIINLKLDFASHLLQSELYTISETASRAGFSDTKYFSRMFKKKFGISPKDYRACIKTNRIHHSN